MRTGRIIAVLSILVTIVTVTGACGGGEKATPTRAPTATARPAPTATPAPVQPIGKLVVALANLGTEDLDPITGAQSNWWAFGGAMFDWALWHNKDGALAPGAVEQWQEASDGLSWTFTLRNGMRFHNGEPTTAEDVKFDIERFFAPEALAGNTAIWRSSLDSLAAPSPSTVVARLKQPWPIMPHFMSAVGGNQTILYPKAAFERAGSSKAFFASPVGSGPYKFASYQPATSYVFEATREKHPYRPQPGYQTLDIRGIPEESTRVALLRTKAADIVNVGAESIPSLKQGGFPILELPALLTVSLRHWGLDNVEGMKARPTNDVRVREALHLAVNRQEILDTLLGGFGSVPGRETVTAAAEGYDPAWKPVPYDPVRAKALLAEAGYPNGYGVQKLYNPPIPSAPWTVRAGEAVAGYWAAIGVRTEVVTIDYGAWRPIWRENPHVQALAAYGWLFNEVNTNQLGNLASMYPSNGLMKLLRDPEVDKAFTTALSTRDANERVRLLRQIVDAAHNAYITIPIAVVPGLYGASPEIKGWDPLRLAGPALSWETVRRK